MHQPGWYEDDNGQRRWWSAETGWTRDVQSGGIPTTDPGPTPHTSTPTSSPSAWDYAAPLSAAARDSLRNAGRDLSPFPKWPISTGATMLLAVAFVVAAVISRYLALFLLLGVLAAAVTGVRSWLRLRYTADLDRELRLLTKVSCGLCPLLIGVVGLGFASAARVRPERRRELIGHGWVGQLVALGVLFAVMAVIGLVT
ncbi:hypothetical protein [Allokutzneria albata]|uniref:hypothetical protein n=1 Tax=Allokutzneria albata TaxID=211114 RepID=UPI0012DC0589|nr:hypothetical protein [Allokutzneria albata]